MQQFTKKAHGLLAGLSLFLTSCNRDPVKIVSIPPSQPHFNGTPRGDRAFDQIKLPDDSKEHLKLLSRDQARHDIFQRIRDGKRDFSTNEIAVICQAVFEERARYEVIGTRYRHLWDRKQYEQKYGPTNAPRLTFIALPSIGTNVPAVDPSLMPRRKSAEVRSGLITLSHALPKMVSLLREDPSLESRWAPLFEELDSDPRIGTLALFSKVRQSTRLADKLEHLLKAISAELSVVETSLSGEAFKQYDLAIEKLRELRPDLFDTQIDAEGIRKLVQSFLATFTKPPIGTVPKIMIERDGASLNRFGGRGGGAAALQLWSADSITLTRGSVLATAISLFHELGHAVVRINENLGAEMYPLSEDDVGFIDSHTKMLNNLERQLARGLNEPGKLRNILNDEEVFSHFKIVASRFVLSRPASEPEEGQPILSQLEEAGAYLSQQCALQLLADGNAEVAALLEKIRFIKSFGTASDTTHTPAYWYAHHLSRELGGPWQALTAISSYSTNWSPAIERKVAIAIAQKGQELGAPVSAAHEAATRMANSVSDLLRNVSVPEREVALTEEDWCKRVLSVLKSVLDGIYR